MRENYLDSTEDGNDDDDVSWDCSFHPTGGYHEVGCPHKLWTSRDLQLALISSKKTIQSLVTSMLTGNTLS